MSTTVEDIPGKGGIGDDRGRDSPQARWTCVEVQMDRRFVELYHYIYKLCEGELGKGLDDKENDALINMAVHRCLCQAVAKMFHS